MQMHINPAFSDQKSVSFIIHLRDPLPLTEWSFRVLEQTTWIYYSTPCFRISNTMKLVYEEKPVAKSKF
jgi:hypothetical protein